jgi:uncharacterized protein (DUF486 family)
MFCNVFMCSTFELSNVLRLRKKQLLFKLMFCSSLIMQMNAARFLEKCCTLLHFSAYFSIWGARAMVFNATFNNISVISWRSILLVDKTRVPEENKLYHCIEYNSPELDSNSQRYFLIVFVYSSIQFNNKRCVWNILYNFNLITSGKTFVKVKI